MSDYYVYNADVYCEKCADSIQRSIRCAVPKLLYDKDDSEDYPQGPYSDEESDTPQHCGSGEDCLDPYNLSDGRTTGKFLENPLTPDGVSYVRERYLESHNEVTDLWMWYYSKIYSDLTIDDSSDESTDEDPA